VSMTASTPACATPNWNRIKSDLSVRSCGKLQLLPREGLDVDWVLYPRTLRVCEPSQVSDIRRLIREIGAAHSWAEDTVEAATLAAGEALANGLTHGQGSPQKPLYVLVVAERSPIGNAILSIRVADQGPGIPHSFIREATLERFQTTTEDSLGCGWPIIVELSSRVLLTTDDRGTVITIEIDQRTS
jgi:anti-sigma regulatory factor (Ser/Thr protein kinase)